MMMEFPRQKSPAQPALLTASIKGACAATIDAHTACGLTDAAAAE
jgi:hypothetical protein